LSPKPPKRRRRGVVDTSVVAAGVAGFKAGVIPTNDSAKLIRDWIENDSFVWLVLSGRAGPYPGFRGESASRRLLNDGRVSMQNRSLSHVAAEGLDCAHAGALAGLAEAG